MPAFIAWLATAISASAVWLVARLGLSTAVYAVFVGVVIAASLALYAAANAAVQPLSGFAPPQLSAVASWCVPTNLAACIAARLGVEVACAAYQLLRLKMGFLAAGKVPVSGAGPFGNQ